MPSSLNPMVLKPVPGTNFPAVVLFDPLCSTNEDFVQNGKAPGTRCPTCAAEGSEVWVIPGRNCAYCGTPCDAEHLHD